MFTEALLQHARFAKSSQIWYKENEHIPCVGTAERRGGDFCSFAPDLKHNLNIQVMNNYQQRRLTRARDGVMGGVCAGIARYLGLSVSGVRVMTLLFIMFGGLSLWVYIALWLLIPSE